MKLCQATGDSEGWVVPSLVKVPASASRLRFGSLPWSMNMRARVGSMPSKPMTTTFCGARRTGVLVEELQAARPKASTAQIAAVFLIDSLFRSSTPHCRCPARLPTVDCRLLTTIRSREFYPAVRRSR